MDDDSSSFPDHRLCGFLCAVLTINSPNHSGGVLHSETLSFGTRFQISHENSAIGFRSQCGVVLSPVGSVPNSVPEVHVSEQCEPAERETMKNSKGNCRNSRGKLGKRKRSIGCVNGSISVVNQLHALAMNKCLAIDARMVWAEACDGEETRAVLLVDVYLPVALRDGWQFPKFGSVAGALFRHLRCMAIFL